MSKNYYDLNASLGVSSDKIDFEADKEAVRQYFLQHVNAKMRFFHSLDEKLDYLFKEGYYKKEVFDEYPFKFIKTLYKKAYDKKYRFRTFMGAYKFYNSYAMKTLDGQNYLERLEDRVVATALTLAAGDQELAIRLMEDMIANRYQPATPTFLNSARARGGEPVSCFLIRTMDNMESISRTVTSALQLSKRGGGVGILLTDIREQGAPIKGLENMSSGVIPVMKILEDSFSYANQLGARQGAGAVYLHAHHPDILKFLDTKRENADEKIRIKTLSLGVVIPDITMQLASRNEPMYLFSSYDIQRVYGKPMSDVDITAEYYNMVENADIKKTKISARDLLQTLTEIQMESGYPYILFEDAATRGNPNGGKINMSNLCSEIIQENEESTFHEDGTYDFVGKDISCNLGSLNVAAVMEHGEPQKTVDSAIRALTNVAISSNINSVPSIQRGNQETLAVGLGQMNLHGYLAKNRILYGSPESLEFVSVYFAMIRYYGLLASNKLAIEAGKSFVGFETTSYADGSFFEKYLEKDWLPESPVVAKLFSKIKLPTRQEWAVLKESVMKHGIRNKYINAVAPTGSISYVTDCTSSIHPITSQIEVRKEGALGRTYVPAHGLTNENREFYQTAYDIGPNPLIDVYAAATEHTDQGLSMTLFFYGDATTRDITKAQLYAFKKGIKSIYYIRIRQKALAGTEITTVDTQNIAECESCSI